MRVRQCNYFSFLIAISWIQRLEEIKKYSDPQRSIHCCENTPVKVKVMHSKTSKSYNYFQQQNIKSEMYCVVKYVMHLAGNFTSTPPEFRTSTKFSRSCKKPLYLCMNHTDKKIKKKPTLQSRLFRCVNKTTGCNITANEE